MAKAWLLAGVTLALLCTGFSARAQDTVTLRFAVPGAPPGSPSWTVIWEPWIAKVEKDSEGTLKLQPFQAGLANLFNVYDRVVSGAADMGSGVQGSVGGKFLGSSVVELPSDIGGRDGAAAFWKIYQDGLIAAEYADVHPLALWVYPQSLLNANRPIARLEEVKGLRLASFGKTSAEITQLLGAAPLSTRPDEVYEVLQRHSADGVIIGWLGLNEFKLHEVTSNHLIAGLGSGGGFLLMNKDAYAKLTGKAKAAIDQNSGYDASMAYFGAAVERVYALSEVEVRGLSGHTITALDPGDVDQYQKQVVAPLAAEWQSKIPNGAAIFAAYRAEAARVRAQK